MTRPRCSQTAGSVRSGHAEIGEVSKVLLQEALLLACTQIWRSLLLQHVATQLRVKSGRIGNILGLDDPLRIVASTAHAHVAARSAPGSLVLLVLSISLIPLALLGLVLDSEFAPRHLRLIDVAV